MRNRLLGVEGVRQSPLGRRVRHELGEALGPLDTHRVVAKTALAPDEPREELHRQAPFPGGGVDQATDSFVHALARRRKEATRENAKQEEQKKGEPGLAHKAQIGRG